MKKSTWIIIGVIVLLVIAVAVFAVLNSGNLAEKKSLESNAEFKLTYNGKTVTVKMSDITGLNPEEFSATMDTSDTDPTAVKFTGVELKKVLSHFEIDPASVTKIQVTAIDGYASAFTAADISADKNLYPRDQEKRPAARQQIGRRDGPLYDCIEK